MGRGSGDGKRTESSTTAQLRKRFAIELPDSDSLTEFLSDYFPKVHQDLPSAMTRTERVTQLLSREDPAAIERALNEWNELHRSITQEAVRGPGVLNFLDEYLGSNDRAVAFGGRRDELGKLRGWLAEEAGPAYALITAPLGWGKSALVARLHAEVEGGKESWRPLLVPLGPLYGIDRADEILRALGRGLARVHGRELPSQIHPALLKEQVAKLLELPLPQGARLLILLDGLDEAASELQQSLRLPRTPPAGLRFLLTARSGRRELAPQSLIEQLGLGAATPVLRIELAQLSREGVREVLGGLRPPAKGWPATLDRELYRLTEGDPLLLQLYLRELIEAREPVPLSLLQATPPGLGAYFDRIWNGQLAQWQAKAQSLGGLAEQVLALLSCTLGPLPLSDLPQILPADLDARGFALDAALRPLGRWLRGEGRGDDGLMLAHPRLAEFFRDRFVLPQEVEQWELWILAYGRRMLEGLREGTQPARGVSSYLVRYLGTHLQRAAVPLEQHIDLVSAGWRQAWRAKTESDVGFLADVDWSRAAAEAADRKEVDAGRPARYLAHRLRCMLFTASATSLAGRVPPELIAAMADRGRWSLDRSISQARLIADPEMRSRALDLLGQRATEERSLDLRRDALLAAAQIEDPGPRAEALAGLFAALPAALVSLRDEILSRELRSPLHPENGASQILTEYLPYLPQSMQERAARDALACREHVIPPAGRASLLARLAKVAPASIKQEILAVHDGLVATLPPDIAIMNLSHLPERQSKATARKAFDQAQRIKMPLWKSSALCALAIEEWVPDALRKRAALDALKALSEHLAAPEQPGRQMDHSWVNLFPSDIRESLKVLTANISAAMSEVDAERILFNLSFCLPDEALPELQSVAEQQSWLRQGLLLRIRARLLVRQKGDLASFLTELRGVPEEERFGALIPLAPSLSADLLPAALALCNSIGDRDDCIRFASEQTGSCYSDVRCKRVLDLIRTTPRTDHSGHLQSLLAALPAEHRPAVQSLAIAALPPFEKSMAGKARFHALLSLLPHVDEASRSVISQEALTLALWPAENPDSQKEKLSRLSTLITHRPESEIPGLVDRILDCIAALPGDSLDLIMMHEWLQHASAPQRDRLRTIADQCGSATAQIDIYGSLVRHTQGAEQQHAAERFLKLCEQTLFSEHPSGTHDAVEALPGHLLPRARRLALRLIRSTDRSGGNLGIVGKGWLHALLKHTALPFPRATVIQELLRHGRDAEQFEALHLVDLLPYLSEFPDEKQKCIKRVLRTLSRPQGVLGFRSLFLEKFLPHLSAEQIRDAFTTLLRIKGADLNWPEHLRHLIPFLPEDLLRDTCKIIVDCASDYRGRGALGALAGRSHELALSERLSLINGLLERYGRDNRHDLLESLEPILPLMQSVSAPELVGQLVDGLLDVLAEFS